MKQNILISQEQVKHISNLSKLIIDLREEKYFAKQFNETLNVVNKLNEVSTNNIVETSQVTGLKNVFRKDEIEKGRILSQKEALSNAKKVHKGFFMVKAVF